MKLIVFPLLQYLLVEEDKVSNTSADFLRAR